jgi:hypothetical protein
MHCRRCTDRLWPTHLNCWVCAVLVCEVDQSRWNHASIVYGFMQAQSGSRSIAFFFLTSALDDNGCVTPYPGWFTPAGNDHLPIVQEDRWVPGPVWTYVENLASTGIQFLDCLVSSWYGLHYPGQTCHEIFIKSNENFTINPVVLEFSFKF